MTAPRPSLSVVVASYNSPTTLERCLESLEAQLLPADELIVADCSSQDPRQVFHREFVNVRFLRFDRPMTIPELRREGTKSSHGEIVALTEGRLVPSKDWAAMLCVAHTTHPKAPAVGGPLTSDPASAFDAAVFFCEYGLHMSPAADGPASLLSGGNVSYKRWALDLFADLLEAAAWEPFWHQRLAAHGHGLLRSDGALVTYHNSLNPGQFLSQRYHYGRWFAALRLAGPRRLLQAALSPLVPPLLTFRLARLAFARGRGGSFLRSLPWILLFQSAWAWGEFCGYLFGKGSSDRRVF